MDQTNNLTLNPDKTTCTLFTPDPADYRSNLNIKTNNTALPMATHPNVLDLTIDPKLTYSTHIHNISVQTHNAYGIDSLSIFHSKNYGPLATEYLTSLYNDSLKSCRLPSIWNTTLVIPIPKPGKDSSHGTSYIPISLLCPAAKVLEDITDMSRPTLTTSQSGLLDQISHSWSP